MSRVGKKPIPLPQGVTTSVAGDVCTVKGTLGELTVAIPLGIEVAVKDGTVTVSRKGDLPRYRALHGLTQRLLVNAAEGVSKGFVRRLEMSGVGYRIAVKGRKLEMELGFSHPVIYEPPAGVTLSLEGKNVIVVSGTDKQQVGHAAAELRRIKPPDPYKVKGIKYAGEVIHRKVGKVGA
jgi:large subunit ribosomal protein L6